MTTLLDLSITSGPIVVAQYIIASVAMLLLTTAYVRARQRGRVRRFTLAVIVLVLGVMGGIYLATLTEGPDGPFGINFTPTTRTWIGLGFGGTAVALTVLIHSVTRKRLRGALAALGVVALVITTAAMAINIDFGQYPTVRSMLGISAYSSNPIPVYAAGNPHSEIATWKAPSDLPTVGTVSTVTIPATASAFPARDAVLYMPPAALTARPPLLPVMVMLSGQPGSPSDPLSTEKLQQALDDYAAAHAGLAPIVVSPDQLGDPTTNPLCIDSSMGKSATYLTVDVPNWIRANLPVLNDARNWAIGGLSQGGTCALQFGAEFPELFGNIVDASGEQAPNIGGEAKTIARGFNGNAKAYEAAKPANILARKAPYKESFAIFGVGAEDTAFLPGTKKMAAAAKAAGIDTTYFEVPHSAHDVAAWSATLHKGLELLTARWKLVPAS
ncbi:alpha/beta hydrolase [Rathayibacter toxicus]|uniref:alpha/beta hydrolase n=1 Tax=Rathayibacter toxicus TaxID=145458 RepID=UPI000CE92174|nr:alpha/beta hydrolase-fold protein [Rathayibacter toxicus]PPI56494.1 hypothetical protein C5D35_01380 [Rathayibacter toxicus]QOD10298.1 hypothetical protein BSG36_10385 [Rathayibacter toxicus]QWL28971.1 hypothetical protein E2R33_10400 [Rathayibacter toxicus]